MTGTIVRVMGTKRTCCFIESTDKTAYFAHRLDFVDPSTMVVGNEVMFRPRPHGIPGKAHPVTDVVAIQRKAA